MKRSERCLACGGVIRADTDDPAPGVSMHQRTPRHTAWRMGLRVEPLPSRLPARDGLPVARLGPAEAFERTA